MDAVPNAKKKSPLQTGPLINKWQEITSLFKAFLKIRPTTNTTLMFLLVNKRDTITAWPGWLSGFSTVPHTKRSPVGFLVRAHDQIAEAHSLVGGMQEAIS